MALNAFKSDAVLFGTSQRFKSFSGPFHWYSEYANSTLRGGVLRSLVIHLMLT